MSQKKSRPNRSASTSETVAVAPAAVTGAPALPAGTVVSAPRGAAGPERSLIEIAVIRMARWLGSLQVAVVLLSLFAFVLAIGTIVESWYSGRLAQELVYRTWWFTLLLGLLGVNIFFAAAKKWPWKKHQTGFLITHVGLLTMVAGGVLNSLGGTDAMMVLVDSDDPRIQSRVGAPQSSTRAIDRDVATIRIKRGALKGGKDETLSFPIQVGSLAWKADEYLKPNYHPLVVVLDWLAHPLPHYWRADLQRGAELEVLGSYPHARREPFSAAGPNQRNGNPAVKVALTSPNVQNMPGMSGWGRGEWVAYRSGNQTADVGPALVEMLGRCPADFLSEFQNPPAVAERAGKGDLLLSLGGETHRLLVAKHMDRPEPLGKTGWKVQVTRYIPNIGSRDENPADPPSNPAVVFELTSAGGKTARYIAPARYAAELIPAESEPSAAAKELTDLQAWYNPPDFRYGDEALLAVLQFVTGPGDKLYYRAFNSSTGSFMFEKAGEVEKEREWIPIWGGMNWKFQVKEYIPRAVAETRFVPEDLRPGLEQVEGVVPALRCRLSVGKESQEFWVGQTDNSLTPVKVGDEEFQVGYNVEAKDLGFEVKLLRAEQPVDPGTQQPAMYTSYVQLTDEAYKIKGQDHVITMNQPMEHKGYKFFQSNYTPLGPDPNTSKPVSISGFTVSSDPGLWLKYIGSSMLALGIACMFYMKAYFFKPRGRQASAAA